MRPTFQTAVQAAPPPTETGPVWPISDHEAKRIHDATAAERAARRAAAANAPAPTRAQPERKSDAEAQSLIDQGRNGLRTLDLAQAALVKKREDAAAAIRAEETGIETTQSVNRSAWEMFAANPVGAPPKNIDDDIKLRRAKLAAARNAFSIAVADEQEAAADFATARADARALIAGGEHHLRINQIERLADRAETMHREAALACAQIAGLREFCARNGDTIGAQYAALAEVGQHHRLPQAEMDRRAALRVECEALRAKFREHGLNGGSQ